MDKQNLEIDIKDALFLNDDRDPMVFQFHNENTYIEVYKDQKVENAACIHVPINYMLKSDEDIIIDIYMTKNIFDSIFNFGILRVLDSSMESSYTWKNFYNKEQYKKQYKEIKAMIPYIDLIDNKGLIEFFNSKDSLLMLEFNVEIKFNDDGNPYMKIRYGFDFVKGGSSDRVYYKLERPDESYQPRIIELHMIDIVNLINWIQVNR